MRIKRAVNAQKKKRKIMRMAKGYFGAKSKLYRVARQAVMKSGQYAYVGRRLKKRDFRKLWIARINAAARMNDMSYSRLMHGLKVAGIDLNRKVLAEIAVSDGVFAGISAGAAVHAARMVASRRENAGKTVAVIVPDTGMRYLSTDLFGAGQ